jgi:Reverse transcriptase (RNA-dependent DNA polymerase)
MEKKDVIPILEDGKDEKLATSYRPFALTSCVCKIIQKMVGAKLERVL